LRPASSFLLAGRSCETRRAAASALVVHSLTCYQQDRRKTANPQYHSNPTFRFAPLETAPTATFTWHPLTREEPWPKSRPRPCASTRYLPDEHGGDALTACFGFAVAWRGRRVRTPRPECSVSGRWPVARTHIRPSTGPAASHSTAAWALPRTRLRRRVGRHARASYFLPRCLLYEPPHAQLLFLYARPVRGKQPCPWYRYSAQAEPRHLLRAGPADRRVPCTLRPPLRQRMMRRRLRGRLVGRARLPSRSPHLAGLASSR
jgi:hypothetical protein